MSLMASVDISLIGCPLSPPLSCFSRLCNVSGRVNVVLVTISPSGLVCGCGLYIQAAMFSLSAGERSGEILTSTGGRRSTGSKFLSAITLERGGGEGVLEVRILRVCVCVNCSTYCIE